MFLKRQATLLILAGILAMPIMAPIAATTETAPEPAVFSGGAPEFSSYERRVVARGVAEYFFTLRGGCGPYDLIGLHRVVKESAPNVPAPAAQAVFLAPGDIWGFRPAFLGDVANVLPLPGPTAPSLPVFLAQNGIDVWGIDFRWTFVPASVTDFSFLCKIGGSRRTRPDLGIAISVARFTRVAQRQRPRPRSFFSAGAAAARSATPISTASRNSRRVCAKSRASFRSTSI